jgi:hypothetical protein
VSEKYPNVAVLVCQEGTEPTLETQVVFMGSHPEEEGASRHFRVFSSTAFRATGQGMALLTEGDDCDTAATKINGLRRAGHKMNAVIGGNKPATWVGLVPGRPIGDLDPQARYIDDRFAGDESYCVDLEGERQKEPKEMACYNAERRGTEEEAVELRSSLSIKEAVEALSRDKDVGMFVKREGERWETSEKMTPVHQELNELFVGGYRDLHHATRVQRAILDGEVTAAMVVKALRQIAADNPRAVEDS